MPPILRSALLALPLIAAPACAQESRDPATNEAELDGDMLMVGLGFGAVPSYEGSNDTALSIVPGIRGRLAKINFSLRGNRFSADLIPTDGGPGWDFQLGPFVQANFNRHVTIIDPQVKKLPKRGIAVETGAYVGIGRQGVITSDYDKLGVSLAYVHDLAGVHDSYVITPSIDYGTPLSTKAYLGVNFSADYAGDGYGAAYFSVDAAGSAASGLPVFTARKGWKDWTLATVGMAALTGDLTGGLAMIGSVSYRRMLEDAARSPVTSIAGSRNQWSGVVGLAYTF